MSIVRSAGGVSGAAIMRERSPQIWVHAASASALWEPFVCVSVVRLWYVSVHAVQCARETTLHVNRVLSPAKGKCYTCQPCDLRFVGRNKRSNLARHTSLNMNANLPCTHVCCASLV
jgi:hypothetical protein